MEFFQFLQYEFFRQWKRIRAYASENGIEVIGDIPIYVALDSADSWAHPELFQFDENHMPSRVAGCPPDAFSADGQLWGNPLYNWEYHRQTDFTWWKKRIAHCMKLYDVVRVDHFRGFDEYYSIPYGAKTAAEGAWMRGPGDGAVQGASDGAWKSRYYCRRSGIPDRQCCTAGAGFGLSGNESD